MEAGMRESEATLRESRWPDEPPVRVCLLIGGPGLSGALRQLVLLAEGLRRRGIEVNVAMLGSAPESDGTALRAAGVDVVGLDFRRDRPLWSNLAAMGRLIRHLRRTGTDVVHAMPFDAYVLGAPLARLAGVPVVIAGRLSPDDHAGGRWWAGAAERFATGMADLVIADARAVADRARSRGVPAEKLAVIYHGVPESGFANSARVRTSAHVPVVLCLAKLRPGNGLRDVIQAAALLRDRGLACTLRLVGDGPERAVLERLVDELGVDAVLLGACGDFGGLLAGADVAVFASPGDGPGNPVAQALAARRPVVSAAIGP